MATAETIDGMTTSPLAGVRKAAAKQMVKAWEAPTFSLSVTVDMEAALGVKQRVPDATVTDRLIECCARALTRHRALNAWYQDMSVSSFDRANIGVAVSTSYGLVVPVVKGADAMDISEIAGRRRDLVHRAREGRLSIDDMTGGTFTVSNLGMQGIDRFTAIVNVPQVAILAVGATTERFVRRDGEGTWVRQADFTLTCDHRAVDGATGAAFLTELRTLLES